MPRTSSIACQIDTGISRDQSHRDSFSRHPSSLNCSSNGVPCLKNSSCSFGWDIWQDDSRSSRIHSVCTHHRAVSGHLHQKSINHSPMARIDATYSRHFQTSKSHCHNSVRSNSQCQLTSPQKKKSLSRSLSLSLLSTFAKSQNSNEFESSASQKQAGRNSIGKKGGSGPVQSASTRPTSTYSPTQSCGREESHE